MRGINEKRPALSAAIGLFLVLVLCRAAFAENIVVLFPSAREPFKTAYEQIIAGLSSPRVHSYTFELDGTERPQDLRAWIKSKSPQAIITLGRTAEQVAHRIDTDLPVYTGAAPLIPGGDDSPGVSLELSPAQTMSKLHDILPRIDKVYFLHQSSAARSIPFYIRAAKEAGLTVEPIQVNSALQAATALNDLAERVQYGREAVWLSDQVTRLNPSVLLPLLQDLMWTKRLVIISNNPADVREGVPIGFYPDYEAMGRALRELALSGNSTTSFAPTAKTALNHRMAKHLGLRLDYQKPNAFDSIFGR